MKKAAALILFPIFLAATASEPERGNLLLVTIDTWRADYVSASGSDRVKTPFIDRMAREGLYLPRVETPAPLTTPSHASILTGLYPVHHGIRDNLNFKLREQSTTLSQLFREKGYSTIAVVSSVTLKKKYGLDRGFDIYDDEGIGSEGDNAVVSCSRNARASSDRALAYALKVKEKNSFIWLHLYDPHHPYIPPDAFLKLYPGDPYAGEVAYTDKVVGDFVKNLMAGYPGRWTVIITSDHGEGLGEKGENTHGFLLYKQTREVPLIIWNSMGKKIAAGNGVKSVMDIFPTVIDLFKLRAVDCDGENIASETMDERWLFSEAVGPLTGFGLNPGFLARRENQIYIEHGTSREAYLSPDEDKNLSGSLLSFGAKAKRELKKIFGEGGIAPSDMHFSAREIEDLGSLGYFGSPGHLAEGFLTCDLRGFAKDFSSFSKGKNNAMDKGAIEGVLAAFDRFLGKYPRSSTIRLQKGEMLMNVKRYADARKEMEACIRLNPKDMLALINLGNIQKKEGKFREAEKAYLSSMNIDEGQAIVHLNLGVLYYYHLVDKKLALKHMKRFLELAPQAPQKDEIIKLLNELGSGTRSENEIKNLENPTQQGM